jgi:hypothetical protein
MTVGWDIGRNDGQGEAPNIGEGYSSW